MPEITIGSMKYNVSEASLEKVLNFFIDEVKRTGDSFFQLTVPELAEKAKVSVATCNKSTKILKAQGYITIRTFPSRKTANIYEFVGNIESYEKERKEKSQNEYLKSLVLRYEQENKYLKSRISALEAEVKRFYKN